MAGFTLMSNALTQGIRVTVKSQYLLERSSPLSGQYAFAYTVRIANEGDKTAQLRSRHWIITDGEGKVQEVRGEGVVGAQPVLQPGQHFEYTSWCVIPTPHGSMKGTYQMVRESGEQFDADVAPFPLALPYSLN
jgi:ApaG protein